MVLRIMMLIHGHLFADVHHLPFVLTDGLEILLGPLKKLRLHIPVHALAMMMSIALRFIPTLIEETDKIMSAQKASGADFETGNMVPACQGADSHFGAAVHRAFRRADELATAMECRCYHGGEGRTRLRQLKYQGIDYATLVFFVAITGVVGVLGHLASNQRCTPDFNLCGDPMERNIALKLMYNGTAYHGWQVQKNAISVAQTLEKARPRWYATP